MKSIKMQAYMRLAVTHKCSYVYFLEQNVSLDRPFYCFYCQELDDVGKIPYRLCSNDKSGFVSCTFSHDVPWSTKSPVKLDCDQTYMKPVWGSFSFVNMIVQSHIKKKKNVFRCKQFGRLLCFSPKHSGSSRCLFKYIFKSA